MTACRWRRFTAVCKSVPQSHQGSTARVRRDDCLQVETLKMGWCNVGADDGAKAVADLLMFNSTLATLDLRGNGLGDEGGSLRFT